MVQKTIKGLYKQPVNYKLIKDGYKTVNGIIQAQDGMPATLELPTPSETYVSDLQYTVDINANGAPILNFNSFTLPDNETCESKRYCYAPKGMNYNYTSNETIRYYDNFTTKGNPSINSNDGVMTSISTSNYLLLPNLFNSDNNTWEMLFKVRTGTNITDEQSWIGSSTGTNFTYPLWRLRDGQICLYLSSNGSSWDICSNNGILNVIQNTWYWMKLEFTRSQYKAYYSTNGTDYTLAYTLDSNTIIYQNQRWAIGVNYWDSSNGVQHPWLDAIDLSQCYIKINNTIWWQPYRDVQECFQIPGMLDPSVTTDNWEQNQNYKLYQLKTQQNSDTLQLTENNITNDNQKYNQYINQITIPARNYKWYYHGIPQGYHEEFSYNGDVIIDNKIATFTDGMVEFHIYPHYYYSPFTTVMQFETGDNVSNQSLMKIVNLHYNSSVSEYEENCIYFSCIHNGKFSITNDENLENFNDGLTLLPNTKYWLAIYLYQNGVDTYLLTDDEYSKYSLPPLSSWNKQISLAFSYIIDIVDNEWIFGQYMDTNQVSILYPPFVGKLYLENCIAFNELNTSYDQFTWEAYYYYNYEYKWMANKSLYKNIENTNTANVLDFSDSYINVSQYTYNQYKNPQVCLMSIDGGETDSHLYTIGDTDLHGCLYNYNDDGSEHSFDVYYDSNYTQPILVNSGETYLSGTKVDIITIPQHNVWTYQAGGTWTKIIP